MAMSTKVEQVDTKEYIKSVIKVNLSAIIIMSWFMISGLLSSYYSVLSVSQMIDLCLVSSDEAEKGTAEKVPWHDFITKKDEKSKPVKVEQEIAFDAEETMKSLSSSFFYYLKKDIKHHEEENEKKKMYHHIALIEFLGIFTKSIEWNSKVISESFQFIQKITPTGVVLMTSFILFPIFLGLFFVLNLFYTIYAWFKSIYGAFNKCGIVEYFDTVLHKKTGNVDPEALSVIGSLFFLLFYGLIIPLIGVITIVPILLYFFITLLVIPIYSLFLPLKMSGKLEPKDGDGSKSTPFTLGTSMFSNIYTYINYYSVAFSIVYALVASILQDAYYFVGCIAAIAVIFMATSFYKQQPFMGGSSENEEDNNGNDDVGVTNVDITDEKAKEISDLVEDATRRKHEIYDKRKEMVRLREEQERVNNDNKDVKAVPLSHINIKYEDPVLKNPSQPHSSEDEQLKELAKTINPSTESPNADLAESDKRNADIQRMLSETSGGVIKSGGSTKRHNKSKSKSKSKR
jgi:hypothetical protein